MEKLESKLEKVESGLEKLEEDLKVAVACAGANSDFTEPSAAVGRMLRQVGRSRTESRRAADL